MTIPIDSGGYQPKPRSVAATPKKSCWDDVARFVQFGGWVAKSFLAVILTAVNSGALAENATGKLSSEPPLRVVRGSFPNHPSWNYVVLEPDLTRSEIVVVHRPGGAKLTDLVPKDAWATLNGGYWLSNYAPTGWVRDRRRALKPKPKGAKGGVVAVMGTKVFVGPLAQLPFDPEFAIQNSPELVVKGGKLASFRPDVRRASRTIACQVRADNTKMAGLPAARRQTGGEAAPRERLLFVLVQAPLGDGPTLREMADFARAGDGLGCDSALNLDGGSSTGAWMRSDLGAPLEAPLVPIGYGLAIVNKP